MDNQVPDILGGLDGEKKAPDFTNEQLKNFILSYMDTRDPMAAAIRAQLQNAEESIMITVDRAVNHPAVKAGIAALENVKRDTQIIRVTRESMVEECQTIGERALTDRQYTSALAAVKLKAQLTGHLEEKVRVTHQYDVKKMSDAELERFLANDGDGKIIDVPSEDITPKA